MRSFGFNKKNKFKGCPKVDNIIPVCDYKCPFEFSNNNLQTWENARN